MGGLALHGALFADKAGHGRYELPNEDVFADNAHQCLAATTEMPRLAGWNLKRVQG